ncbi:MAG: aquaporin [Planctomycetota bacterium]
MPDLLRASICEFIGTFGLVFFGCGSIVAADQLGATPAQGVVVVAIAFTAILVVCVTAFIERSGAQFNPAVSIALVYSGEQTAARAGLFVVVQLIAAAAAVGMLVLLLGREAADSDSARVGHAAGVLTAPETAWRLVLGEALLTFFLMSVILWAIVDGRARTNIGAGLCVGLTVGAAVATGGFLTGASLNPARSFGPALYGHWELHWAYWVGPIAGAVAASLVHRFVSDGAGVPAHDPAADRGLED